MKRTLSLILAVVLVLAVSVTAYAVTASGDTIVFRTSSGTKYHTENCSSLKDNGIEITLAEAVEKGLEPCSKCNPPTLAEGAAEGTAAASTAATAAATATATATARKGFSPVLAFFLGVIVGVLGISYIRGKILEKADAEAEEDTSAKE